MRPLELWGGAECTIARIGDDYRDEARETGHHGRLDDLDRIAALGIRTVRLPILWETVTGRDAAAAWAWHDARLDRARHLGITPIAGLLHHGSGPRDTSLLDPSFPERFASHAAAVAARYPGIRHYTPVNEPLTTARFSALYGHWYPHATDEASFFRALLAQCKATLLAMRAVRRVRPDAVLVQTEDLGRTFSTTRLAYQAAHDNERRWLSFDLLLGRVDPEHPFHARLLEAGARPQDLDLLASGEGAPDILGINHYLTSDRYLDQRIGRYPPAARGGNAFELFADVEAVRVDLPPGVLGPLARLREAWERYGRPLAVTEVSHGCTRDEQIRWLVEVWTAAQEARAEGIDVRAVTPWALFGSIDWRTLLTRRDGLYEPGAFDVRGPAPRPTALARAIAGLAAGGTWDHPVLDGPAWWRRPERLHVPAGRTAPATLGVRRAVLLVGADDAVRDGFRRIAAERGLECRVVEPLDVLARGADGLAEALAEARAWAVVETGSPAAVAAVAAEAAAAGGVPLASLSPGRALGPDARAPARGGDLAEDHVALAAAERDVLDAHAGALIPRVGLVFGPWKSSGPVWSALAALAAGRMAELPAASLTYLPDLAHAVLDLMIDGECGVRHLVNPPDAPPVDALRDLVAGAGFDPLRLGEAPGGVILATTRGALLPTARSAIARFLDEGRVRERLHALANAAQ